MSKNKLVKITLPFLIIIITLFAAKMMISNRKAPIKTPRVDRGALVETMVAKLSNQPVQVNSNGTIQPRQEVTIIPQVSGLVTFIANNLHGGGFFNKGEKLFEIETVDYELALEQARANLAKMGYELSSVEAKARIAILEWNRLKKGQNAPKNSLALYEPQLKNAKANLASAQASLRQAEINLERTTIKAPFNCVIRSESLDRGQYVKAGTGVIVIAGSNAAEVIVPIKLADLHWLTIPDLEDDSKGSPATITLNTGNGNFSWQSNIDRSLAEVDPQGRMARLVVSIKDPYLLKSQGAAGQPALAIGSFVEVSFQGKIMEKVFTLPRQALRDNNTVWVMTEDNLLKVKPVKPIRLERNKVFIDGGIDAGDKIILTNLTGAANGMKLRATKGEGS